MPQSKAVTADLQADISATYDPTKTSIYGTVAQRMLSGVPVLAPPLVKWTDVIAASGETIIKSRHTSNNRIYGATATVAGAIKIVCGSFDTATGLWTYIGKINVQLPLNPPAAVYTIRDWFIDDDNTSNIQIILQLIATGVNATHNSGIARVYKLALTDFTIAPPTISAGTTSDSKAVYFEQDPANLGILNTFLTAGIGMAVNKTTKDIWVPTGTLASATWTVHKFNYSSVPTMTVGTSIVVTVGTPGVVNWTGHNLQNADAFVFTGGTLPTGLSLNTVYYARNVVAGVSFEVSLLITIASSVTTTGTPGSATICRASGITTGGMFTHKTGAQPAVTGAPVALLTGCVEYVTPQSGHAANNGTPCVFIGCATAGVLIPASEITNGATNFPNLSSTNLLGLTNQVVTPAATVTAWDNALDRFIYVTNTSKFVAKKCINNIIEDQFGVLNVDYLEGVSQTDLIVQFGAATVSSINIQDGWIHINSTTTGQRGIISLNSGSSYKLGQSHIITKVLETGKMYSYVGATLASELNESTGDIRISYRTNVQCDFSDDTTGWITLDSNGLMNTLNPAGVEQIQFKIQYKVFGENSNPAQAIDVFFAYIPLEQFSSNWVGSGKHTTQNTLPSKTVFKQEKAYTTPVTLLLTAYKSDGSIWLQKNTASDYLEFSKSNNDGLTVTPFASANDYYNTVNSLVYYNWTTPPDEELNISWQEV